MRASWPSRGPRVAESQPSPASPGNGWFCVCAPQPPPWLRPCGGGRTAAHWGPRAVDMSAQPVSASVPTMAVTCHPPALPPQLTGSLRAGPGPWVRIRVAVGTKLGFVVALASLRPWVGWGGERGVPPVALSVGHVAAPAPPAAPPPAPPASPWVPSRRKRGCSEARCGAAGARAGHWADATHAESAWRPHRAVSAAVARSHFVPETWAGHRPEL